MLEGVSSQLGTLVLSRGQVRNYRKKVDQHGLIGGGLVEKTWKSSFFTVLGAQPWLLSALLGL